MPIKKLFTNEYLKYSHSKYLWIIIIFPIILSFSSFVNAYCTTTSELSFLMSKGGIKNPWVFLESTPVGLLNLFLPLLAALIIGIIYDLETKNSCWNTILTFPLPLHMILLVKLSIALCVLTLGLALSIPASVFLNFTLSQLKPEFQLKDYNLNYYIVLASFAELLTKGITYMIILNILSFHFRSLWIMLTICVFLFSMIPIFNYSNWNARNIETFNNFSSRQLFSTMIFKKNNLISLFFISLTASLYTIDVKKIISKYI